MFLDAFGNPKEVTPDNLHEYSYDLHETMLLTSADHEVYIPPKWHGTIYSTEELLQNYKKRYNPDPTLLTFHALQPYEPEFICCENVVVELTALPAGQSLFSEMEIVVFLVKLTASGSNMLITKELGSDLNFFPHNHHYHARILNEGIDVVYVDDKIYSGAGGSPANYQHQRLFSLLSNIQPGMVKSLSGGPLPEVLRMACRKPVTVEKN
ncbi:uncharacterized protein [Drosophila kikkawai]|uniref:Uncharacterized protein n=1 Tax=Drosophila kikkawai TaxID=30033 RepID=A0A6P4HZM8_DROKI|nr:uncharacterized protein LOC108074410 [Drosophila kikkawai]KAH8314313.1 hypothetical protein KR059_000904 [Drosophila kikkawai]